MLKDILAISGQSGLYKLISTTKNGVIVENIEDKKRMPAYSTAKISALDDIAIYMLEGDDKPLNDIFKAIRDKENGAACLSHKSDNTQIKQYFELVVPGFDIDRVYVSDMKKVLQWYNILQSNDMLAMLDQTDETKTEKETENKE